MHLHNRLLSLIAATALLGTGCAQSKYLVVEHDQRKAWIGDFKPAAAGDVPDSLGDLRNPKPLEAGDDVLLRPGRRLSIRVFDTNTAFYTYKLATADADAEEVALLKTFLGGVGPYATGLPADLLPMAGALLPPDTVASPLQEVPERVTPKPTIPNPAELSDLPDSEVATLDPEAYRSALRLYGSRTDAYLRNIDQAIYGSDRDALGLRAVQLRSAAALDRMHRRPGDVDAIAKELRSSLSGHLRKAKFGTDSTWRLSHVDAVVNALGALPRSRQDLQIMNQKAEVLLARNRHPNDSTGLRRLKALLDTTGAIATKARGALDDAEDLVGAAYGVQSAAVLAATASGTWPPPGVPAEDSVRVRWDEGKALTFSIEPVKGRAPLAVEPPFVVTANVRPRWLVRPHMGLAYTVAPWASFSSYSAKEVDDGVEIAASPEDRRFAFHLSLALTPYFFHEIRGSEFSVWPAELLINPSDEVRSLGLGGGISWRALKVSAGALWTKHDKLAGGQQVGQRLPDAGDLATRETYGRANVYFTLTMGGWPPFVPE